MRVDGVENAGAIVGAVSCAIVRCTSCAACTAASGTSGEYGSRAMRTAFAAAPTPSTPPGDRRPRATDSDGATYS